MKPPTAAARTLSHEETLRWIAENKAWQLAYVWGGRALRAVATRSDSAIFPRL